MFEHPLAMVFESYGSAVLFFRKPIYQEVLERLKIALENCKKSASNSTDFVDQFKKRFTEVLKQKLNACHIHSLAFHFFEDWLEAFPLQVNAEFHESINIPGTAELLLNLLEDSAASIPLQFDRGEANKRAIPLSS